MVNITRKHNFCKTVILFVLVLIFSCSQDPIFFIISTETKPIEPIIPGGPTNMVQFERMDDSVMFVASGSRLYWYYYGWDSGKYNMPQPGGRIGGLAATKDHLYALCDNRLRRIGHYDYEGSWQDVPINGDYTLIDTIYADPVSERLFAGARINSASVEEYGILYLDDNALIILQGNTKMLTGAATRKESGSEIHYLCTLDKIYKISDDDLAGKNGPANEIRNGMFVGMIRLAATGDPITDDPIIVVDRNSCELYRVDSSGIISIGSVGGKYATGALAVWRNPGNPYDKMFTAGIQGGLYSTNTSSSYTNGYVEFPLSNDGQLGGLNDPPTITVDGFTDRYTATIGKHPINHLFQAQDNTFFASTQSKGLWSYRVRDGGPQWNAED
jgi:hypothetical protein